MPEDDDRWQKLRVELEQLPTDPVTEIHPRRLLYRARRVVDILGHARPNNARLMRRLLPLPKPFEHRRIRTEDNVQIAAWYGPPDKDKDPPFGLVNVPGMFATKDDQQHRSRSIAIHKHWGVPVLNIDLRAFGESTGIATGGWKEALDVHAAARFLREEAGVERVAVMAESMGGAAALNALAHDSQSGADLMTGGCLTWSAFVDTRDAVKYISSKPPRDDPFRASWEGFRRMLRFRSMGGYESFEEYLEDAARVKGLEGVDELYDLANPKWKVGMMRQPTLLVHAMDDPVVPVRHARRMERYARNHPHIQVLVVPFGRHTSFEATDPHWFWEVTRRWFGAVNDVELPNPTLGKPVRPRPT